MENVQLQVELCEIPLCHRSRLRDGSFRKPKESPPKGGICERRTEKYAAVTRDKGNAADGRFPTASIEV